MDDDQRWFILGVIVGIGIGLLLWGCFVVFFYVVLVT